MNPIKVNIILEKDGNMWCAHFDDFVDLQSSVAAFGSTTFEAVMKLLCTEEAAAKL